MNLQNRKSTIILFIYLLIWFAVNLLFLTDFPFVHSDEPWLSGLSRSIIEKGSLSTTEDFFDLWERNPHSLKILFHILQIFAIRLMGYSLFTVRLISLTGGVISLFLFYKLSENILTHRHNKMIALATTIWMSCDVQFIYISHLARQEIFMILLLLLMLNISVRSKASPLLRGAMTGIILGIAVGFHPNSFIIAWPIGLFLLLEILQKKRRITEGLTFLFAAALVTVMFILISLNFNPNFFHDYSTYGNPLGVMDSPDMKILRLPGFYRKLFFSISGTYYTAPIKLQMALFPLLLIGLLFKKKGKIALCGFLGFNIGLFIIGKYSQPSISFLIPFYYLLWVEIMALPHIKYAIPLLVGVTVTFSIMEAQSEKEDFSDYTVQLNNLIPPGSSALGNLYCEYAMSDGQFYDWRNLPFLRENGINLSDYISERKISYIILTEEISFIYKNRPYWNVLYGNTAHWYPELIDLIDKNFVLIGEFESPAYGMRITAYRYRQPWSVKVYKLLPSAEPPP